VAPRDVESARFHERQLRAVDDARNGGGPRMVMLAEPWTGRSRQRPGRGGEWKTIYLSPQGSKLDHEVMRLAKESA